MAITHAPCGLLVNVIIWDKEYKQAWTFQRRPIPTDPHFLVLRIAGKEVDYTPSGGLHIDDLPGGKLPSDARKITKAEANALPTVTWKPCKSK